MMILSIAISSRPGLNPRATKQSLRRLWKRVSLELPREPLPDVVLLDIHLGNKSGLTLVHWARKQRHLAHLPIAAVTGLGSFKELKSIQEAGCDTCFTKPIDFRALREYLAGLAVHSRYDAVDRLRKKSTRAGFL